MSFQAMLVKSLISRSLFVVRGEEEFGPSTRVKT